MLDCLQGGGPWESGRRPPRPEPCPGLTWGLQRVEGRVVVGLCALSGRGVEEEQEEVLFGGAGLRAQDLVAL